MTKKNSKCVHIRDIVSLYSDSDKIVGFHWNITFSSTGHEYDMILELCSEVQRANMAILWGLSTLYFKSHFPLIHELGVLIPFVLFEEEFLVISNVALS